MENHICPRGGILTQIHRIQKQYKHSGIPDLRTSQTGLQTIRHWLSDWTGQQQPVRDALASAQQDIQYKRRGSNHVRQTHKRIITHGKQKSRIDNYTHTTSIRTIYPYNYIRLIIAQWQQKHLENSTKLYKTLQETISRRDL